MLLKEVAEIEYSLPVSSLESLIKGNWLNCAGLLQSNMIESVVSENRFKEKTIIMAEKNDLLLKRISPTYINVYESNKGVYLGTNIIRIRLNENINPYFIAMVIEGQLSDINQASNKGTALHAINRVVLENIELPNVDIEKQFKIGELYRLSNNKEKLIKQLLEKEQLKSKTLKNKLMSKLGGNL